MKLIIDIPDHLYSVIKNKECTHVNILTEAVYDGTPLDDIRAEIEQEAFIDINGSKFIFVNHLNQIIDRHIGEGSKEC